MYSVHYIIYCAIFAHRGIHSAIITAKRDDKRVTFSASEDNTTSVVQEMSTENDLRGFLTPKSNLHNSACLLQLASSP